MIVLFEQCHVLFIHTPLLCSSTSLFLTTIFASTELNHQLVQIRVIARSKPRQTKGVMLIYIILKSCSAIVLSTKEMSNTCESIPKYRPTERFKDLCDKDALGHRHLKRQGNFWKCPRVSSSGDLWQLKHTLDYTATFTCYRSTSEAWSWFCCIFQFCFVTMLFLQLV